MKVKFFSFSLYDVSLDGLEEEINEFMETKAVLNFEVTSMDNNWVLVVVTYKPESSLASMVIKSAEEE